MKRKFKLTYTLKGSPEIYSGGIEDAQGLTWFREHAPFGSKLLACEMVNGDVFAKLPDLMMVFRVKNKVFF